MRRYFLKQIGSVVCGIFFTMVMALFYPVDAAVQDLTEMSIEELMEIKVTSVSKREQQLSDSAAAIFVITNEDLKRSGVTTIPDALRMVPGLNVARIDSNKWAVNSRGVTSRFADKLLVLLDGRSIYTPFFSGVYWEVQDLMLEDVDRIEVIRGPGATLWGANAVNGVINIVTKSSRQTQGGLVSLGAGSFEHAFASARYGMALAENIHARFYVKGFKRNEFDHLSGGGANDDWDQKRIGFRTDALLTSEDTLTFQGDLYSGDINQDINLATTTAPFTRNILDEVDVSGGNILTAWKRVLSSSSEIDVKMYYDRTQRKEAIVNETRDSFDFDFQHHFAQGRHDMVYGVNYRYTHDYFDEALNITVDPDSRDDQLLSLFLQDEIMILENRLWLTLGSKFEHNDYSGYEVQPSARLFWAPHEKHKFWTAVSRAVSTPSRAEHTATAVNRVIPPQSGSFPPLPVAVTFIGNSAYDSEELIAYELGYRFVPRKDLSFDTVLFYNEYDNLRSIDQGTPAVMSGYIQQPMFFRNNFSFRTYGAEFASAFRMRDWLKFDLAYTFLKNEGKDSYQAGEEPRHQVSLRSTVNAGKNIDIDLWLRYVDKATAITFSSATGRFPIDRYLTLDLRVAWRPFETLELCVVGQNLLESSHMEAVQENFTQPTAVERSVYAKVTFRF